MEYDIHSVIQLVRGGKWMTVKLKIAGDRRSRETFAVLANVCNDKSLEPISEPKGLPEGFNDTFSFLGEHAHSYHTLSELEAYLEKTSTYPFKMGGYIPEVLYLAVRDTGAAPPIYCGDVDGTAIVKITDAQYREAEANQTLPPGNRYVWYEWPAKYTDCTYLADIVKDMQNIAFHNKLSHDNIRYVFGFTVDLEAK